jgi:hypothetical protein
MCAQKEDDTQARQGMQVLRVRQEHQEQLDYSLDPHYDASGPESEDKEQDADAGVSICIPRPFFY